MVMKKKRILSPVGCVLFLLFSVSFVTLPTEAEAQAVASEGVQFDVSDSLRGNLKTLIGEDVSVNLRSGTTYRGFVKSVGDHFIHLEKIAHRDFFDALIRMEDIAAIEVQFRGR
jgi:small nuclear ribonucleoprotein (snRNP)-like protein